MHRKCSFPRCDRERAYSKLRVCRTCYSRIWWTASKNDISLEKAKAALIDMDEAAYKHGIRSHAHKKSS